MRRIAYIQYTNPAGYPPLEHSSRLLADDGWKVLFLGAGVEGVASLHFPPHDNIIVRQLSISRPGWRQKLHYAWFVLWAAFWTLISRSSWVYASDPLSCPAALLLSFAPGIRAIYHEHDSPTLNYDGDNGRPSLFIRFALCARRILAGRAAICVLPNERRAELFTQDMGQHVNVACVWNCPTEDEVGAPRPSLNGSDLRVVYHGSLVPSRLPTTVIEALALLPERVKLRAIGYETAGHQGYVARLRTLAAQLGIAHRVEFVDAVPRAELFAHCREGDVGLAFMPKASRDINEQAMTGASNKPFDYLACGLALLVSDLPDWRAFYVEPGYALGCDPNSPESIAKGLQWFCEHPDETRRMGERGRQSIRTQWNYERQFEPVLQELYKVR